MRKLLTISFAATVISLIVANEAQACLIGRALRRLFCGH